jgi:hypothetical protein
MRSNWLRVVDRVNPQRILGYLVEKPRWSGPIDDSHFAINMVTDLPRIPPQEMWEAVELKVEVLRFTIKWLPEKDDPWVRVAHLLTDAPLDLLVHHHAFALPHEDWDMMRHRQHFTSSRPRR